MNKVIIELWLPEDEEINDINVGKALGIAIMTNDIGYVPVSYIEEEE